MQKIIEIEQHLLFFIDFIRVPKYRVRPIILQTNVIVLLLFFSCCAVLLHGGTPLVVGVRSRQHAQSRGRAGQGGGNAATHRVNGSQTIT